MQRGQLSSGVYSFDFVVFKTSAAYIQLFDKSCPKSIEIIKIIFSFSLVTLLTISSF